MKKYLSCLLLLIVSEGVCDSMYINTVPDIRAARPMFTTEVEMIAESVFIIPANSEIRGIPLMQVNCVFYLRNLTDERLSIEAGFPFESFDFNSVRRDEQRYTDEILQYLYSTEIAEDRVPGWLGFSVSADNVELPFTYMKGMPNADERFFYYPLIAVWNMNFEPGETVRLENNFYTGWNQIGYSFWESNEISYIVRSGSTWSGPIGDAVIHLEVPEEFPLPFADTETGAWWEWTGSPSIESRSVTWHYSDWEPEEDISLRIFSCYPLIPAAEPVFDPSVIRWTKEELIDSMKEDMQLRHYYPPLSVEFMLSLAEMADCAVSGRMHPDIPTEQCGDITVFDTGNGPGISFYTDSQEYDPERAELICEIHDEMTQNRSIVQDRYFSELFPCLAVRRSWSEANLAMFAADPELQIRYLLMLENMEPAVDGESLADPRMSVLYNLTGWYVEGYPMEYQCHDPFTYVLGTGDFELERDVVREFWMSGGGCEVPLIRALPDTGGNREIIPAHYSASSELSCEEEDRYSAANLQDDDSSTSWVEGADGHGYGEAILITADADCLVSGCDILNGYCKNDETWRTNGRVAKLIVDLNGIPVCVAELLDDPSSQFVEFTEVLTLSKDDKLEFSILEIYPGTRYEDTAVSGLHLF